VVGNVNMMKLTCKTLEASHSLQIFYPLLPYYFLNQIKNI